VPILACATAGGLGQVVVQVMAMECDPNCCPLGGGFRVVVNGTKILRMCVAVSGNGTICGPWWWGDFRVGVNATEILRMYVAASEDGLPSSSVSPRENTPSS